MLPGPWGQGCASLAMVQVTVRSPCWVGGQGRLLAVPETIAKVDEEACGPRAETGCEWAPSGPGKQSPQQPLQAAPLGGLGRWRPQAGPPWRRARLIVQGRLYAQQRRILLGSLRSGERLGSGPRGQGGRWFHSLICCPPGGVPRGRWWGARTDPAGVTLSPPRRTSQGTRAPQALRAVCTALVLPT